MVRISFDDPLSTSSPTPISVTVAAAQRISVLQKKYGPQTGLFIQVKGGGCHGYSYAFQICSQPPHTHVHVHPAHPAQLVFMDENSQTLLSGSVIDYQETLEASQFIIHNPQAHTGCGCGNSFSL